MKSPWLVGFVAFLVAGFGAWCVFLGHDGVVVGSTFGLLGAALGVPIGRIWEGRRKE